MINKEVGTFIFILLVVVQVASIIYGFVKMIPNKKIPIGAKVIFGVMFFGVPFVGPMAYIIIAKNWDSLVGNPQEKANSYNNKSSNDIIIKK